MQIWISTDILSSYENNTSKVLQWRPLIFEIYAPEIYEMCVYKYIETIEYYKK